MRRAPSSAQQRLDAERNAPGRLVLAANRANAVADRAFSPTLLWMRRGQRYPAPAPSSPPRRALRIRLNLRLVRRGRTALPVPGSSSRGARCATRKRDARSCLRALPTASIETGRVTRTARNHGRIRRPGGPTDRQQRSTRGSGSQPVWPGRLPSWRPSRDDHITEPCPSVLCRRRDSF